MAKKIEINTTEGKHSTYVKLSDVLKELDYNVFVNCHKSYIINLNHVKSIVSTGFYTHAGHFVPISRSNYQMAKKSFISFHWQLIAFNAISIWKVSLSYTVSKTPLYFFRY